LDKGWAFCSWAVENDGWLQFNGIKRSSPGYLAQQIEKLMKEANG